jgi:SNF2 family DNA or RNA helicase
MLVHPPSRSLLLRSKDPQAIQALIPQNRPIDFQGHNLAVRHGLDEVRLLRNLGINAPSPILTYYNWPGKYPKPFEHQRQTAAFLTLHPRCFCLNEMGTAKTASALWAADYLMLHRKIHKVLIVAPLSTLELVWMHEIFSTLMHRKAVMLYGSKERRIERLGQDADFYIVNYDGLPTIGPYVTGRYDIDLVIVDEAAAYRNAGTDRYSTLLGVIGKRRLWLLSGTPCPNAPTDAWALARLVNKDRVPQYFSQWRRQTMIQISQFKWVPRADSYRMAYDAMQPAVRFKKADCLDLPPVITERREADLSDEQKSTYRAMKNRMVMDARGQQISAVHAADQINKLRQILCGAVRNTETGGFVMLDHAPRFQVLVESIEQASAKVVVIVPFKPIIEHLHRQLALTWSVEVINGDVSRSARTEIINRFKNTPDPHVLLCHPAVMSHGLNLTEADMIIFYAPSYSNELYQQVQERINRPGQTRPMTVVRIGAGYLDWEIYRMVDGKAVTQENILSLYKREVEGYKEVETTRRVA